MANATGGLSLGKGPTPEKAKEMLRDGTANGEPLTGKQKRFFGARAGGTRTSSSGAPIRGVKRGKSGRGRTRPR